MESMVEYIICYTYLYQWSPSIQRADKTLCSVRSVWNLYVTSFLFLSFQSEINPLWVLDPGSVCVPWDLGPRASKRPKENNIPQIPWSLHTDDRIFIFTAHVCFADVVVTLSKKLYNAKPTSKWSYQPSLWFFWNLTVIFSERSQCF